jgi:ABC-type multidrug transport system permease subunit
MEKSQLVNWDNGSIIIVFVFGFVIVALVVTVLLLMKNDRKKE